MQQASAQVPSPIQPEQLSINTATLWKSCDLPQAVDALQRHGIRGIAPWRDRIAELGLREAARVIRNGGLTVTGLCRGGMFTAPTAQARRAAIDDNLRAVDEAAMLDARCLVIVPQSDGTLKTHRMKAQPIRPVGPRRDFNRTVYAAAHVVIDPFATRDPWDASPAVDWDATLAFREHLYGLGFRVAEAMDTAQRGMGVDWPVARELIQRSLRHARIVGGELACGVGTDQLPAGPGVTLAQVEAAYREQIEVVEQEGGHIILMASRALRQAARGGDDYLALYGKLLRDASQPVVLHWLGEMFDPALRGYWGSTDLEAAMETVVNLIGDHKDKIEGIKVSLLDPRWELELRRRLPAGVKVYTGDDFNYAELIAGDENGYSHGLLGIFDPIAPVAAAALNELAAGNTAAFRTLLDPTVELSREIFRAPTRHYKAGVVFLAWLNGHQAHFSMAGGLQSARGATHYARIFELADACGALADPELAALRMKRYLAVSSGVEA